MQLEASSSRAEQSHSQPLGGVRGSTVARCRIDVGHSECCRQPQRPSTPSFNCCQSTARHDSSSNSHSYNMLCTDVSNYLVHHCHIALQGLQPSPR